MYSFKKGIFDFDYPSSNIINNDYKNKNTRE